MDSGYTVLLELFNSYITIISNFVVINGVSILCFSLGIILFSFIINNVFKFARASVSVSRNATRLSNRKDYKKK